MPQIGQSNVLSPGQPATHCYSAKSKFSSGQFPFSPLPQASTEVINKIYKAPRRALFPGETTKGQSHRKPLSAARMPLYQPHLTLMIVFFFFFRSAQQEAVYLSCDFRTGCSPLVLWSLSDNHTGLR